MYSQPFHSNNISNSSFLITGGAGFIGSNIVQYLLKYNAGHVRVIDNLSNGYIENLDEFNSYKNFEFIEGDIRDYDICKSVMENIDFISHQAALGSVPRSILDPISTNSVNIDGFLNILNAVKENPHVKRLVYAASSSTYGDSKVLPKIEGVEGAPLSPYAVTKLVNELYADVFSKVYNINSIGLRYFNVFGPKQNPNNPYAAVIPLFCKNILEKNSPIINGDGLTSRDFTFVENVVQANVKAFFCSISKHEVVNVACGDSITLNELVELLNRISGNNLLPIYKTERVGDVKHSLASIEKIKKLLDYQPYVSFEEGLKIVYDWYKNKK